MTKAFESAYAAETNRLNNIRSQIRSLQGAESECAAARCALVAEHLGFAVGCAVVVAEGFPYNGRKGEVAGFLEGWNSPKTIRVRVRLCKKSGVLGELYGEFDSGKLERIETLNLPPGAK